MICAGPGQLLEYACVRARTVIETIVRKRIFRLLAIFVLICAPWASAQDASFIVSDIRVEGLQRISPGSVFAAMPLAVGDLVNQEALRAAARSLFATGNFDDIRS